MQAKNKTREFLLPFKMLKQAFKHLLETMFHWFLLQLILRFNLFSVSPWQFVQKVQKMTGVGIGHLWNILPLSTGSAVLVV